MKITGTTTLVELEIRLRALGLGLSVQFVASERLLEAFVSSALDPVTFELGIGMSTTGSARGEDLATAIEGAIQDWARRFTPESAPAPAPAPRFAREATESERAAVAAPHHCATCAERLMFSARLAGNGLCGPCRRHRDLVATIDPHHMAHYLAIKATMTFEEQAQIARFESVLGYGGSQSAFANILEDLARKSIPDGAAVIRRALVGFNEAYGDNAGVS
jgi:hypothetical protein